MTIIEALAIIAICLAVIAALVWALAKIPTPKKSGDWVDDNI